MKRVLTCLGIVVLAIGVALVGCDKKTAEDSKPAEPPAAVKTDTAKADVPSSDEIKRATDEAAKMLAATGDGSDAPEYMKKMVEHLKAMNKIMKDNLDSCDKVAAELTTYTKEHEAALGELKKEMEAHQAKMTDEEKMKMAGSVMGLIAPIMQDMMTTQSQFTQKCPEQAVAVQEAMKAIRMK